MLAHCRQILLLERMLEADPVLPRIVEVLAEHPLEVVRVGSPRAGVASPPLEQLLRPVLQRQVAHEPRAIQVRVRTDLEVDLGSLRDQSERVVEARAVADHRAEHHFVVPALRPAVTAAQPGLHEYRAAFMIPARRRIPRTGQVVVEQRSQDGPRPVRLFRRTACESAHLPRWPDRRSPGGRLRDWRA